MAKPDLALSVGPLERFFELLRDKKATRPMFAQAYEELMVWHDNDVSIWREINGAIRRRYTRSGLIWIKKRAWASYNRRAKEHSNA